MGNSSSEIRTPQLHWPSAQPQEVQVQVDEPQPLMITDEKCVG